MKHYFYSGLCVLFTILIHGTSFSQEGNVWTFGSGALVDFGTPPTSPTVGTSSISSYEGCASISDNSGNLVFYTDGINVWDNTNTLITSSLNGNWSTAQSGIIVPQPGLTPGSTTNNYYIFSIPQLASGKVNYSIYNSTLHTITTLNALMPDDATAANTTESITVARHCNGIDYWVVTHEMGNNKFKAYQVTNAGVASPVASSIGPVTAIGGGNINSACYMKMAPNSKRLGFMVRQTNVNLFDFDPSTGVVSNSVSVATGVGRTYYGIEFSPNSNVLYYTDANTALYDYNISTGITRNVATVAAMGNPMYALQTGPDGNIYIAKDGNSNMALLLETTLDRIINADNSVTSSVQQDAITLAAGTAVKVGLPNIIPPLVIPPLTVAGNTDICNGSSTNLTASGASNYNWSPATGLNTTTGPSVIANPTSTQTYIVYGTSDDGCLSSKQVTIEVKECCFAASDPAFTQITSDVTYSSYTVLSGKYYVADGVIITVDATTLDMTGVDMVFGECAGINFVNGAEVIAYNSVFRTCDETKSWRGFSFSSSHGNVSESTFKNAQKAIRLEKQSSVRVTNNNFLNDQISVYVFDNTQTEAISGNTFTTNNVLVDFEVCNNTFVNTDAYAIWARTGTFEDVISQNQFVNADFSNSKKVYGVYLTEQSVGANISFNSFTNQYNSVYASGSYNLELKNNTVELTDLYTYPGTPGDDIQFYFLKGSSSESITGNIFKGKANYSTYAVYIDGCTGIDVADNELRHFAYPVQVMNARSINVINNQIEHATAGIYSQDVINSYYGCNVINCYSNHSNGIEFWQTAEDPSNCKIVSNCIYNTATAIYLNNATPSSTTNLPFIRNNFLYSYQRCGVLNSDFNGNIGSGLGGLTAGKNTFESNNVAGGAIDIATSTPLTSYGNYGITNISGGVSLVGTNTFYSTSSCGSQLGNATTEFSNDDLCVIEADGGNKSIVVHGILINDFETTLASYAIEDQAIVIKNAATALASETTTSDMIRLQNYITASELASNDQLWALSKLYFKQPSVSLTYLGSIEGMDELVSIETINLHTLTDAMTTEQFDQLNTIQQSNSENREVAREAMNVYKGGFPYRLKDNHIANTNGENSSSVSVAQNDLILYPNPASDKVSIQFTIPANKGSQFSVTDLSGKIVRQFEITEDFSTLDLDISELRNGLYIISILQSDNTVLTQKLSVLH